MAEKPVLASAFDLPRAFKVSKVRQENYRVKTLYFDAPLPCKPGQFVMVWVPGVNERPLSVYRDDPLAISIANVGDYSAKLFAMKPGDQVGVRGPYGNAFELKGKNILLVGGGYGLVPLSFLALQARERGVKATVVMGARKADDLILERDFEQLGARVVACTDDGSKGAKALSPEIAAGLMMEEKFSAVYGCGPEKMEAALVEASRRQKVPCFVSVERFMKCGFGICGACAVGDKLACAHGPIFSDKELEGNADFGKSHLDEGGKRHPV